MSDIKFYCPACRQRVVCDAEYGGQKSTCPTCHTEIVIPSASLLTPTAVSMATQVPPLLPQSYVGSSTATSPGQPEPSPEDLEKSYQTTMNVLGGFGIGVGVVNAAVGLFLFAGKLPIPDGFSQEAIPLIRCLAAISCAAYLAAGFGAVLKKTWAIYALLVLGYVGLINSAITILSGNSMAWIWAWVGFAIVQRGHAASGLRKKLKRSNIRTSLHEARFAPVAVAVLGCASSIWAAHGAEQSVGKHPSPEYSAKADQQFQWTLRQLDQAQRVQNNQLLQQAMARNTERFTQLSVQNAALNNQLLNQQSLQQNQIRQSAMMQQTARMTEQMMRQHATFPDASRQAAMAMQRISVLNNTRAATTPYIPPVAVTQPRTYSPPGSYTYPTALTVVQPRTYTPPLLNTYTPPRTYSQPPTFTPPRIYTPPPAPYIPPPPPRIR